MSKEVGKKKMGCLVPFIVVICFMALVITLAVVFSNQPRNEQSSAESNDVEMVLDAMSFYDGNKTISESKLIELKGEPDEIEEWNYKSVTKTYPIRTLYYGNYAYHFNNGILHRISIDDVEIPYKNKEDILKMFGLKKYKNSEVADTNFAYRVTNCGVYDFWVAIMDEDSLNSIRISYSSLFQ